MCTPVTTCGRDVPFSNSFVVLTLQLLGAFVVDETIICCGGAHLRFVRALD